MRKLLITSLVMALALVVALPAMAVDVHFTGSYRLQGFMEKDYALAREPGSSTDSYLDMRFRLETTFQITDRLSLVTRFDALDDKKWGRDSKNTGDDGHNIDWQRTFMRLETNFGHFEAGRREGGMWGTSFADTETDRDSIYYMLPIGNFGLKMYYEKVSEQDAGNLISDGDTDKYYFAPFYRSEKLEAGVLYSYSDSSEMRFYGADQLIFSDDVRAHLLAPYFIASFGPLSLQGELMFYHGRVRNPQIANDTLPHSEFKVRQMAGNLEGTVTVGPAAIQAGYAYMSGDRDDVRDGRIDSYPNFGEDWEKLYILTTSTGPAYEGLGGTGNLAKTNPSGLGVHLVYAGADLNLRDNLTVGAIYGFARTQKEETGVDKKIGHEVDLTLNWRIYPNLTYTAVGAWFSPGKYWDSLPHIGSRNLEDAYSLFHNLTLSF